MEALVHFAVGLFGALVVLTVVNRPPQEEFLLTFISAFWAMIPDGHWMLREFGIIASANAWRAIHDSVVVNVFWFHGIIDAHETGRNNLEAGVSLAILFGFALLYYQYNDWTVIEEKIDRF